MYKIILINNKLNVSSFVIPDASIFENDESGTFQLERIAYRFSCVF